MKRPISLLVLLSLLILPSSLPALAAQPESLSAECAVLYDAENRRVLWGKNETARHPMASTTKIMTALVAIEALPPDTEITVPKEAVGVEGSSVYLGEGERYTLEALLYALLLQSANDAAEAIAIAVSGSVAAFAERMNERAKSLGLTDTSFENPHGLDGKEHYTTARDLAAITAEAIENPLLAEIVSTVRYSFSSLDGENSRVLINHNKMLLLYEGAVGVKTGYTKKCGRCLVTAARRDGLLLIAATLDAPNDWSDHKKILDYGFEVFESRLIASPGELSVKRPVLNAAREVSAENTSEIRMVMKRGEAPPTPQFLLLPSPIAPIQKGDSAGEVIFTAEDGTSVSSPLVYSESVVLPKIKKGWFQKTE